MAEFNRMKNEEEGGPSKLPTDVENWSMLDVRHWAENGARVDAASADILLQQKINGASLLILEKSELSDLLGLGPAKLIIRARDELLKQKIEQPFNPDSQYGRRCKPYPFHRHHDACRYQVNGILDVTESGAFDYLEPCHEYKAYINTQDIPVENKMKKFTDEVIRFASACMNSRTNGTIHFGIGDKPEFEHGQVLGVELQDVEGYDNALKCAIEGHFEHKHIQAARLCIKPTRFVEVLNPDTTTAEKYVIEVDIVPDAVICEENIYHIYSENLKKAKKTRPKEINKEEMKMQLKLFYVRDGSSSRNLLAPTSHAKPLEEYNRFVDKVKQLSQLRKEAEAKRLSIVKNSVQGSKLSEMITGGSQSLDKTHFQYYVIVTNKSHPIQLESLDFLPGLNPIAVLDFDPESAKYGLEKHFEEKIAINVHLPERYKITDAIEDIVSKLKLSKNTSWVFCNGVVDKEMPSDTCDWLIKKGASVRDVISFLCRKDVLPHKKFLVVFLLLSTVSDKMDPLLETFSTFLQQLEGTEQILCLCENENAFICWKDLIEARYGCDISARCIYELSLAEINGTMLSLWSNNRKSKRFLPGAGGSKVLLEKKVEGSLDTLNVLCVNQCEGGSEDKADIEEKFYKGGEVSWWNFFFSEQPGSTPFIKRDKFNYIMKTIIPSLRSLRKACVSFHLRHIAGCGGTTLAMHILWALKDEFRCAVLKDTDVDFDEVAHQVVDLLKHDTKEETSLLPVLLMVDNFEEMDDVYCLQQRIDKECVKRNICARTPQVFLLNCMTAESLDEKEATVDCVFIGNELSPTEQKQFEKKLEEIEKSYQNTETFYGFMFMKKNFSPDYMQGVAQKTLKSFNIEHKNAQLIAVLVLLNEYCKGATLAVSLCEEFLDLQTKPCCGSSRVEDGFGKFSPLLARCTDEAKVVFSGIRLIHSSMSFHCLQELTTTYNVTKAEITNLLLNTDKFYECIQGKGRLIRNVHKMLVKRCHSKGVASQFSPLIQDIEKESPGSEETVLFNAAKRFEKDAVILQLLARYQYIKRKNFMEAKDWARKAKDLSRDNSYIHDTSAQILKSELVTALANDKDVPITSDNMRVYLKMALLATDAFKETHEIAKKEATLRLQNYRNNSTFNTVGCLGEIQVAVHVIEVLKRTPVFSSGHVRHDILSEVLTGNIPIQKIIDSDRLRHKHTNYYHVLIEFKDLLYSLRYRMKKHFDFLDSHYVHLGSRFAIKDQREERTRQELFKCFQTYVNLFCKTDSSELLKNPNMVVMLEVHKARQFLERYKADTYSGILSHLSNNITVDMETIVRKFALILTKGSETSVKERVNFIYANVALSCVKPQSRHLQPYQKLLDYLFQVLREQIPSNDILPLHFIAVALLWPLNISMAPESEKLNSYISQMRTSFHNEMRSVYSGKRPVVHFFLGGKQGYNKLIHRSEIEKCVSKWQENFASLWENGKIWTLEDIKQLLCRVTGEVQRNVIKVNCRADMKIEVTPIFKSQISGYMGKQVSFYVGFTMNGPLAFDIQ